MFRVGDPRFYPLLDFLAVHCAMAPARAEASKPVAETPDILVRQPPASSRQEDDTEENRRLARESAPGLLRMEPQPSAFQEFRDPGPPFPEVLRIIVKQRKIVHVANVALRAQHLLADVVQAIKVEIGEELAREIADGKAAPPLEGGEQVVAGEVFVHRFLRIRAIDDPVRQRQRAVAGDPAADVGLEDFVIDRRKIAVDIASENVPESIAERLVAGDGAVRSLALAIGVAVMDEPALEDGSQTAQKAWCTTLSRKGAADTMRCFGSRISMVL